MAEWYRVVPEYSLWIMAETLPNMLAYMRAAFCAGGKGGKRKKVSV